jgi:hypothetical protein
LKSAFLFQVVQGPDTSSLGQSLRKSEFLPAFDQAVTVIKDSQIFSILFIPFKWETTMRKIFIIARAFKNWLGAFNYPFQLGFITASEIAYADWPESARRPPR